MTQPFLITGLPRSRTAWMATVCNLVPEAFCYHEPLAHFSSWEECFSLYQTSRFRFVGISDSALGFHLHEIMQKWNPRVLVIERDISDVRRSLAGIGIADDRQYCALLRERLDVALERCAHSLMITTVSFSGLENFDIVKAAIGHLLDNAEIDWEKVRELMRLSVQVIPENVWGDAERARTHAPSLLGADVLETMRAAQ